MHFLNGLRLRGSRGQLRHLRNQLMKQNISIFQLIMGSFEDKRLVCLIAQHGSYNLRNQRLYSSHNSLPDSKVMVDVRCLSAVLLSWILLAFGNITGCASHNVAPKVRLLCVWSGGWQSFAYLRCYVYFIMSHERCWST